MNHAGYGQVPANINSGNPNVPFPQFLDYNAGALKSLGSTDHNMAGVPHAEMELRIREAYAIMCNDMTYTGDVVAGVKYIKPSAPNSCTCVEGDGYYLLAAAYMGDKATFDGYYMWAHDRGFNKTVRFIDGVTNSATYLYSKPLSGAGGFGSSTTTAGGAAGGNSAADGDFDVAMALLVAYKQWGSASGITPPSTGVQIDYKQEALSYIHGLVDANANPTTNSPTKWDTGDIGFDGYVKGGDTWNELTGWATAGYTGMIPEFAGPRTQHIDYYAPAYFRSFYEFFTAESQSAFSINQFKRAEASSDWLIGQMASQGLVGFAGWVDMSSGTPAFSAFDIGEDFRTPWRTNLNFMWNGNPTTSWDPVAHQVVAGGNTYEYNLTQNSVAFFNNPQAKGNSSISLAGVPITYCGPVTIQQQYLPDGTGGNAFRLSWPHATFAPAAVSVQDFTLMTKMYRQCEITWDGNTDAGQQYLGSKPRYFHEWFRLMGMLILSGNYNDPMQMLPTANMKVYKDVNKTYAAIGDTITYTISYRNYGKLDATAVQIVDNLPAGLKYLSSSATASVGGSSITFNVGTVKGTNVGLPANLAQTSGSITMKVIVQPGATGRLCNTATITCSNGTGWTSNEYPNNVTETMQRNCVDILTDSPLTLKKAASKSIVQVGDTLSYTIVVKNKSVAFLNGGRPGVEVAVGNQGLSTSASEIKLNFRIYHGADEAYINYKNYRVSYFLNKPGPPTWAIGTPLSINEGFNGQLPTISQQNLTPGTGYNHRFFIGFPDQIGTITPYILNYYGPGGAAYIHRGAMETPRLEMRVYDPAYGNFDWTTDWSADPAILVASGDAYFPVANDWTDPNNLNIPITKLHPDACTNASYATQKILVEEFDGYTWRRIYGNAPVSGRELDNVKVTDTLPAGVTFGGYFPGYPTGTLSGNVISWPTIATMNTNDSTVYRFWVTVKDATYYNCPTGPTPATITNKAGARATNETTALASATTSISCTAVVIPSPSITKTADKTSYAVGDNIVYTITHKNLSGSIVSGVTAAADWNDIKGNGKLNLSAAGVVDLNASWTDKAMVYKYSHGTNGTVKGSMKVAQDQVTYAVVVRQTGNKWVEVQFKVTSSTAQISVFDYGITAASTYTQIGAMQTIPYTNIPGEFDFQIGLVGSQLNFWLVNPGVMMSTTPQLIFTGVPVQAGYAGVRSTNGTSGTLLENWYTNLDSEFNLQMTDPLLSNLSFVSAATTTYNATTYTGSNVAGTITWQSIPGPILKNDVVTYTWTAKVTSCSGPTITNIAYAKIYGITPNPAGISTVACVGTSTCAKPTSVTISAPATTPFAICQGSALTLKGTAVQSGTSQNGGFYYTWYKGTTAVTTPSTTYADYAGITGLTTDAATYKLRVEDGNAGNASCYTEGSVVITVNALPTITGTLNVCVGSTTALTGSGTAATTSPWTSATTSVATVSSTGVVTGVSAGTSVITYVNSNGCGVTATVTVNPQPTITGTLSACIGSTTTLVGSGTAATTNPWVSTTTSVATVSNTGVVTGVAAGTSVITYTNNNGCGVTATVTVNPSPTITGTLGVCIGSTTTLTGSGTAATTSPWVSANTAVATVSSTGVVTGVSAGTSVLTYTNNNGCKQTATVTVNALPTITGTLSVCISSTTTLVGSGTAATTSPWTSATTSVATVSSTGVVTGVSAGTSVITYVNSNGCGVTATVTVNPQPTITGTLSACIGSTTTLTGSGTAATTNPWVSTTTSVATVSNTGVVTGVAAGTSVITYTNNNGCGVTATVTVTGLPTITGTLTVCAGLTTTLTGSGTAATTSPWTSATTSVATVDNAGAVTGVSAGTSVITYTNNNGCKQTATVTVNALPTITGTLSVCAGLTTTLTGSGTPATTGTWSSASTAAATVSGTNSTSGVVTAVAAGSSVITYTNSTGCKQTATVTVNALPTITGTLTVCAGLTTTLTGSGTAASTNPWVSATTSVATVDNAGVVTGVAAGTSVITYTNSNGCIKTATVTVTGTVTASVAIATPSTSVCTGTSITFTATPTGGGTTPTYQWMLNNTAITSATNATYTTTTAADNDSYTVVMTSTAACASPATVTSNPIVITITTAETPAVTITASPGTTVCAGTGVTFTANPGGGGSAPTYKWYVNGALAGATNVTYLSSVLLDGDQVMVKMVSNSSCATTPNASSNVLTMSITAAATPSVAAAADNTTICPGATITFTATPTQGGTTPTYQWKKNGTAISGETNSTYVTTGAANNDVYTVDMKSNAACAPTAAVTSNPVTITVTPVPTISVSITADNATICANNPVNYATTVTGSGATPAPTYEWFITSSATVGSGTSQGAASTTATTFGTSALTATNNKVYVQVVSNAACAATTAVASNVVAVTVNAGITAGSIGSDQTICYNGTVAALTELTTSTAVTPSYAWEAGTSTSGPWTAIPGATNANYTPPAVGVTTDVYLHRVVTDGSAPSGCASATSNIVHITVLPQLVAGTISADETTCSGAATTAMTSTLPTGGTGSFTYQWQSNTSSATGTYTDIAGATNATYPAGNLTTTTYYQLVYTSVYNTTGTCGSVTSTTPVTKTVTTTTIPTVSINDPGQTCDGTGMTFTATAAGAGTTPTYQWYLGTNPVGTNSNTYAYTAAIGDNGKSVTVKVTSSDVCSGGPVTSAPVVLNIAGATTPTVAITTPTTQICVGMPATFTATGTGTGGSPSFQWYENGNPVGTNSPTYTSTTLASSTDQVWVSMTSSLACIAAGASNPVLSNKVSIAVKPIPTPAIVQATAEICSSEGGFTFTSSGTNTGSNLQWQLNTKNISGATGSSYYASDAGDYTLVEDNGSCTVTSNPSTLSIIANPAAYAGPDLYVTEGTFVQLQASGGISGTAYSWTPTTGLSSSTISNPSFKAENTTTYTVTLSNTGGASGTKVCTGQSSVTVVVVKPIVVPNVITVNGDGSNDTWKIQNIEGFPNATFEIFNRWGNLVWKSTGYPKQWDGTNFRNGEVLPDGTYFYIIDLHSPIFTDPYTGWIQIIK